MKIQASVQIMQVSYNSYTSTHLMLRNHGDVIRFTGWKIRALKQEQNKTLFSKLDYQLSLPYIKIQHLTALQVCLQVVTNLNRANSCRCACEKQVPGFNGYILRYERDHLIN